MSVTIRDIARQTGRSVAAVSQALMGIGRLSPQTRETILAAAKALGYRRDPLLSQAFSRIRQHSSQRYRETLGMIVEWKTKEGPDSQKIVHAAALDRANRMGYMLEEFPVLGNPSDHRKLSRMLVARGIRGLIVIPRLASPRPRLNLEWEQFATVEIGRTLWSPRNHNRVESGEYPKVLEALHLLKKVGYRRIGMAVEPAQNAQHNGIFYATYLLSQMRQTARQRIPIFDPHGPWTEDTFRRWFSRHRPDVLFVHRAKIISIWLERMGLRVPEDTSLFCTNVEKEIWSGLARNYEEMGNSAVEMVFLLLKNGSLGLPKNARCLLLDEFWNPGKTLSRPIIGAVGD